MPVILLLDAFEEGTIGDAEQRGEEARRQTKSDRHTVHVLKGLSGLHASPIRRHLFQRVVDVQGETHDQSDLILPRKSGCGTRVTCRLTTRHTGTIGRFHSAVKAP